MVPTRFPGIAVVTAVIVLAGCSPGKGMPRTPLSATPVPVPVAAPTPPPVAYTLSGVVFESTAAGRVAVEGVHVYCDACGSPVGHTSVFTTGDGSYSFGWAYNSTLPLLVQKDGYTVVGATEVLSNGMSRRLVTVSGDTRFDIELVRR